MAEIAGLKLTDSPALQKWLRGGAVAAKDAMPDIAGHGIPTDVASVAETEFNKITADATGPLYDQHHPKHGAAYARWRTLSETVRRAKTG